MPKKVHDFSDENIENINSSANKKYNKQNMFSPSANMTNSPYF